MVGRCETVSRRSAHILFCLRRRRGRLSMYISQVAGHTEHTPTSIARRANCPPTPNATQRNMKSVIVAALLVAAATVVGASSLRVKKDVGSKNSDELCVYADVSKTGKKSIVCGDPAPPTLASVLAGQLQRKSSTSEARVPSEKCFDLHKPKNGPVSVYVQPQSVSHQEQPHYEQLHVLHHQAPQVQYVQPQQPLVHYQPTVVYQKPVTHVVPYKSPCSQYGGYSDGSCSGGNYLGGGYPGGGYSGGGYRVADEAYPIAVLTRTVDDADEMAGSDGAYEDDNMQPMTQNYVEAAPYEDTLTRKGFGGGRPRTVAMRPTPLFVPAFLRSADPYGYEGGAAPEWQPQQRFVSEPEYQFPQQSFVSRSMASAVAEGPFDRRQLALNGYMPFRPETVMSMPDRYNYGGYLRTAGQQPQQQQQIQQQLQQPNMQQQQLQQQQQQQQQMPQQQLQQQLQQQQQPSQVVEPVQLTGVQVDGAMAAASTKAEIKDLKSAERKKIMKN